MKILQFILLLSLTGCSVVMAAKKKGVEVEDIMNCRIEACILALKDTAVVDTVKTEEGKTVTYRSLQKQGSGGRAAMHGVLDVLTLGIWEVAGTPIEGGKGKDKYYIYKIVYDNDDNVVKATIEAGS